MIYVYFHWSLTQSQSKFSWHFQKVVFSTCILLMFRHGEWKREGKWEKDFWRNCILKVILVSVLSTQIEILFADMHLHHIPAYFAIIKWSLEIFMENWPKICHHQDENEVSFAWTILFWIFYQLPHMKSLLKHTTQYNKSLEMLQIEILHWSQ